MKKIIIVISTLVLSLFSDDYIPLSNLSDKQKEEYNFINKNSIEKIEEDSYKKVKDIKILNNQTKEEKQELSKPINKEFVKEYKKDNILKDERKISQNNFSEDFSITPKLTYSFLKTDVFMTGKVSVVEERGTLIPELSIAYKNHILKAETMNSKAYFEGVLINNGDFSTDSSWDKLSYLYKYQNVNMGLGYNVYTLKGNFIFNQYDLNFYGEDKEEFPSLDVHFKNEENNLQAEYGASYGKNNNIDYSYEYYLNLGYKLFKDNLIMSAGYKNKTIEIDGVRFQYKGPILTLGGTF